MVLLDLNRDIVVVGGRVERWCCGLAGSLEIMLVGLLVGLVGRTCCCLVVG